MFDVASALDEIIQQIETSAEVRHNDNNYFQESEGFVISNNPSNSTLSQQSVTFDIASAILTLTVIIILINANAHIRHLKAKKSLTTAG